eukprot:TRINITY_DN5610_c0_g1_i1.p1 TRINITY_DN5610_c0_g1~~TRINITY_DN5610_c0_g1_i1.p1  ORF type:complete len:262 (-),score=54.02 TRINITY_DN5610_c0_g1_i1:36-821(-)
MTSGTPPEKKPRLSAESEARPDEPKYTDDLKEFLTQLPKDLRGALYLISHPFKKEEGQDVMDRLVAFRDKPDMSKDLWQVYTHSDTALGRAVKATKFIPRLTPVLDYDAQFSFTKNFTGWSKEALECVMNPYFLVFDFDDKLVKLDGQKRWRDDGRLCNDFRDPEHITDPDDYDKHDKSRINVELQLYLHLGDLYATFMACRDIKEGEELLWDYGETYWEMRVVVLTLAASAARRGSGKDGVSGSCDQDAEKVTGESRCCL